MKYYMLTDKMNNGEIVKAEGGGKEYVYWFGAEEWRRSGIMLEYLWPEDALYEMYEVVDENKAQSLLAARRTVLDKQLEMAAEVAKKAHEGQTDKGGIAYIEHPRAVADCLESTEQKIVALLHDVCEDSATTPAQLLQMGFWPRIVRAVELLTKPEGDSYEEYLARVKANELAWYVKQADLKHNMDLSRIPNPTVKDLARVEKYKKALEFLNS